MFTYLAVKSALCGRVRLPALLLALSGSLAVAGTPFISLIPDMATDEATPTPWTKFLVYDSQTGVGLTNVTGRSSNQDLLPDANISLQYMGYSSNWYVRLLPADYQYGSATVTISATNEAGEGAMRQFLLTVSSVNTPPSLDPLPDRFLYVNAEPQTVPLTGISSGAPDEIQVLTVSAAALPAGLLTDLQVAYASPDATGTLTFGCVPGAAGTATVTVTVNDGGASNNITQRSFAVTLNNGNYSPTISSFADVTVLEDVIVDDISYRVKDLETDPVQLQVTAHSSNQDLIPDANIDVIRAGQSGLLRLRPLLNAHGAALITVTVRDADGGSANSSFNYTVIPANDPPTLDPIADLNIDQNAGLQNIPLTGISSGAANEPQTLSLFASVTTPGIVENLAVAYTSPNSTGALTFSTVPNAYGSVLIDVLVDDGAGLDNVILRTFSVTVNPNNLAPLIGPIPDQVTEVGTLQTISITLSDDQDPEALELDALSSNPDLLPLDNISFLGTGSSRAISLFPAGNLTGIATVTVIVRDAGLAQSTRSFVLTVRPDVLAPGITSHPLGQTVPMNGSATFTVSVIGQESFSYQWQKNGTDLTGQTGPSLSIPSAQAADAGDYTVRVSNASGSVTSAAAKLRVLVPVTLLEAGWANGLNTLSFSTLPDLFYTVEYKNSFSDTLWRVLEIKPGTGASVEIQDPGARVSKRFYRVRVD